MRRLDQLLRDRAVHAGHADVEARPQEVAAVARSSDRSRHRPSGVAGSLIFLCTAASSIAPMKQADQATAKRFSAAGCGCGSLMSRSCRCCSRTVAAARRMGPAGEEDFFLRGHG